MDYNTRKNSFNIFFINFLDFVDKNSFFIYNTKLQAIDLVRKAV